MASDERRRRAVAACQEHDATTLWAITDAWLTLHGKRGALVSAYTRRNYRQGVEALVLAWRQENLLHPGRDAAALWIRGMETTGLAASTITVRLAAARALYRALRWAGATTDDPLADVRPAADPTPKWEKREPYAPADIEILLATADPHDKALVLLGAHGGLRVSEMLDLVRGDLQLGRATLQVRQGKGNKARTVALSAALVTALQAILPAESDSYLFPYRSTVQARNRLHALCTKTGVPWRGIHALRHACGTRLYRQTHDIHLVSHHLGHADISTTQIYVKFADDGLQKTLSGW